MTTTVAQLIAHLQTLPQDAIVEVLKTNVGSYSVSTSWEDLDLEGNFEIFTFEEKAGTKGYYDGKTVVFMGEA